jgi:hypothetical protein
MEGNDWEFALPLQATRLQLATEGFSSTFYTTIVLGWRLLHFFIVNEPTLELLWKSINFS